MFRLNIAKLRGEFRNHRMDAARRGISFEFTFHKWLQIWLDSGHLAERGPRKSQYVMARFNDTGPYAAGNVKIITAEENTKERVFSDEWRAAVSRRMQGNQSMAEYSRSDKGRAEKSRQMMGNQIGVGNQNATGSTRSAKQRANIKKAQRLRRQREQKSKPCLPRSGFSPD